jgi:3-hydroxybutyryl-CoA dehydrogenase
MRVVVGSLFSRLSRDAGVNKRRKKKMRIIKVCVVGAGIMGSGIAQVAAQAGFTVSLWDMESRFVGKGPSVIETSLARAVTRGKLSEVDANATRARVSGSIDLETSAADAELVIEAIVEIMEPKKKAFDQLDHICTREAILASNTSGLSVTELASVTRRPGKIIGMHFANPVPAMRLVELIRAMDT